jgi:hypothetical protein
MIAFNGNIDSAPIRENTEQDGSPRYAERYGAKVLFWILALGFEIGVQHIRPNSRYIPSSGSPATPEALSSFPSSAPDVVEALVLVAIIRAC